MEGSPYNCIVLLGPTAVGKTSLAVRIASHYGWDIISADSRQVYKGLDLGSGKDLSEYTDAGVRCHLLDVATLQSEYNVFNFQQAFYSLFDEFSACGKMPFVCGGTGMYVDSVVRGYSFVDVPRNELLRKELSVKSLEELGSLLLSLRPNLHNRTDLLDRERTLRAIEIETFMQSQEGKALAEADRAKRKVKAFVLGLTMPRENLRQNIKIRLKERFDLGMIDEVRQLHERDGYSWERLEKLGLEYRFISQFLEGKIASFEELFETLYHAICQFAKRQETWFRGMERKGVDIHWLSRDGSKDAAYSQALDLIEKNVAFV